MCKIFHPFVITVITVIVIARWCLLLHSFLFSKACGEATRHQDEFIGSPTAELYESELSVELRSVECRVERSVGLAIDVDVDTLVYMWIALLHMIALLVGGVLDEEEVVVGIACDCSVKVVADTRQTKNILRFRMFDSLACH